MGDPNDAAPDPDERTLPNARNAVPAVESPWMTIISAVLFLYVGFGLGYVGSTDNPVYNGSVTAFTWGARIVGIGLLVIALLTYLRLTIALSIDVVISGLAALGCLAVGVIWLVFGDREGILVLLFGVFNLSAARSAFVRWRAGRARLSRFQS